MPKPFQFYEAPFTYKAPNVIEYDGHEYDITDPDQAHALLSGDSGNVSCILDTWIIHNLPPRWAMHCMCHLFPEDAQHAAFSLNCDLRGNPVDVSTPYAQHDWITNLYRKPH